MLALKNSAKNDKMDLVVDALYYRILDQNVCLSEKTYNIVRSTLERYRRYLIALSGFNGAFPAMEDPVEYDYLNTPPGSSDSEHREKEPEKPLGR